MGLDITTKLRNILFFVVCTLLVGCAAKEISLEEVKGEGLTYSEFFKPYDKLDERENITYYKPLSIDEIESFLPEQLKDAVKTINTDKLPFDVNEEKAYLVTSKEGNGEARNQLQLSYLSKSEYDVVADFFIISITEMDGNPLKINISKEFDTVGNQLKKDILVDDIPIFQQVITTNSALVYSYYDYDETKNRIFTVGTSANEIYAYYNGYVYQFGYFVDSKKNNVNFQEKMLGIAREYILGTNGI